MAPVQALLTIARFPRVMGWRDAESSRTQFELLGDLIERVPVAFVDVPWGPPFPPDLPSLIMHAIDDAMPTPPV